MAVARATRTPKLGAPPPPPPPDEPEWDPLDELELLLDEDDELLELEELLLDELDDDELLELEEELLEEGETVCAAIDPGRYRGGPEKSGYFMENKGEARAWKTGATVRFRLTRRVAAMAWLIRQLPPYRASACAYRARR